jgi:ribosomal protein L16 Arg81 hydroxylase
MLNQWIDPIEEEEFFSRYWGAEALLIKGDGKANFANILSGKDLEEKLSSGAIPPHFIYVEGMGELAREREKAFNANEENDDIALAKQLMSFSRSYEQGLSLRFLEAEVYCPLIEVYKAGLREKIPCREILSSLIISPLRGRGITGKSRDKDFFLLQLEGSTTWDVQGKIQGKYSLEPGDFLYLPAGFSYRTKGMEERSSYICFSLTPDTWLDLMKESLADFSADPKKTSALPFSQAFTRTPIGGNELDEETFDKVYKEKISSLLEDSMLEKALSSLSQGDRSYSTNKDRIQ